MSRLVDLARYSSLGEAQVAKSYLAAQGIEAFVPDEHLVGNFDCLGIMTSGVRLQVLESDLAPAREFLARELLAQVAQAENLPDP